jgi:ribosomal-protein-alanine N-acetyltransferase
MRHFPAALSRAQSNALVDRIESGFDECGYGLWAVERVSDGELLGFTGLQAVPPDLPFAPATEIGWRLARAAWGHGYATEAAQAALVFGASRTELTDVVSFTSVGNERSRAVMCRLGMTHQPSEDFDHPQLSPDSPLRRHVLYRLDRGALAAVGRALPS